jgi:hypothetical protein
MTAPFPPPPSPIAEQEFTVKERSQRNRRARFSKPNLLAENEAC